MEEKQIYFYKRYMKECDPGNLHVTLQSFLPVMPWRSELAPNVSKTLAKRRDRVRAVFQQRLARIEKVGVDHKTEDGNQPKDKIQRFARASHQ